VKRHLLAGAILSAWFVTNFAFCAHAGAASSNCPSQSVSAGGGVQAGSSGNITGSAALTTPVFMACGAGDIPVLNNPVITSSGYAYVQGANGGYAGWNSSEAYVFCTNGQYNPRETGNNTVFDPHAFFNDPTNSQLPDPSNPCYSP
jgi:hypothetical protein